jgi:hypothetical protein
MVEVKTQCDFNTSANEVWNLIAGFNTLPDYHGSIKKSEPKKGGAERHLTMADEAGGGIVVERLVRYDDEARAFSYKILELIDCPLPLENYRAYVNVVEIGPETCRVHWNGEFDPVGVTETEAVAVAEGIYAGCYDGIRKTLNL